MRKKQRKHSLLNKKNCKYGRIAFLMAIIALVVFAIAVYIAFRQKGAAGSVVGYMGLSAFVLSFAGFIIGLLSFKEEEKEMFYGWLGSFCNAFVWLFMIGVFLAFV